MAANEMVESADRPVGARLRVTQTRSTISHIARNRGTIRALGLRRVGDTVEVPANDATRGMVRAVRFLVEVEEIAEEAKRASKTASTAPTAPTATATAGPRASAASKPRAASKPAGASAEAASASAEADAEEKE
jgi:large subunit ribosomal protein L30